MSPRILIVEDEPGLAMTLCDRLTSEGHSVETANDGDQGLSKATAEIFDLIILDVMLPHRNGYDVCRDLRQRGVPTPIIMLTARGETTDKVVGLKLGADDYVTKPFEMAELLARVEAQLRRGAGTEASGGRDQVAQYKLSAEGIYQFGDVHLDFRRAEARRSDQVVELSAKEFKLLRYLIEHRGVVLSRDQLLNEVWGYDSAVTTRTIDVHIAWLRQKLEQSPRYPEYIVTIHGLGYKFVG